MAEEEEVILEGEEPESGLFRWMSAFVVLLAIAGFFGLAWYAYKNGGEAVDDKDVELIKADKTPVKEAPANPGGMQIPNQDKTVYGLISGKSDKPVVERILPAPEEPIARSGSGDTETWMSDSVKNTAEAANEEEKPSSSPTTAPEDAGTLPATQKEQFNPAKIRAQQPETTTAAPVTPVTVTPASPPATPAKPAASAAPAAVPAATAPAPAADKKEAVASSADDADDDEAKPAAKAEPKAAAKPPAGARVQLGAYKSQGEAEDHWEKISQRFSDDLSAKQHYVVRVDLGDKGVYYRLQVAPFASSKDAEQFCLDFVSAGQGCILARGK